MSSQGLRIMGSSTTCQVDVASGPLNLVPFLPQLRERAVVAQQEVHRLHREGGTIARERVFDRQEPVIPCLSDEIAHPGRTRDRLDTGGAIFGMIELA